MTAKHPCEPLHEISDSAPPHPPSGEKETRREALWDILIVGGGVVGLTAALAMAKQQYKVALIDGGSLTANINTPDLRVYAINQASKQLLTDLHVWQHMDKTRISPYTHMHVWDGMNGSYIDFDSRTILSPNLGAIIEESVLKQALLEQIHRTKNINLYPNSIVEKINTHDDYVKLFSQDVTWEGQLLMIADGANSPLRQLLNVEITSWPYNHHALVATIEVEKSHQQTAYQIFNADGPLAFLPLVNPHHCSIVWSTTPQRVEQLMTLNEDEFNQELTLAFANQLGRANLISKRHQFPLQMRHTKQYVGQRWLLMGDAAHTIHPLAGQGLNLGLADVRSWLDCINSSKSPYFSKKTLGAYQRHRKNEVWQVIMLMEGLKRFFSYTNQPVSLVRSLGIRLCNEFTPLKRLFIQQASGS